MFSPNYFVMTQIIIDDIYLPNGFSMKNQLGGGVYTVAGLRIWSDKVSICSGLGDDFVGAHDAWFIKNGVDVAACPRDKKTMHSRVNYFPDGEREEIPFPGCGDFRLMQPKFSELPESYGQSRGMYLFKDCDESFWSDAKAYFRSNPMVKVWEISADGAMPENKDIIADCLPRVELFSLNLTEGKRLCGESEPERIIKKLHDMHAGALILRMGENGALVSDGKQIHHIPAAKTTVVDVTGGGNSSTGGFLAGYCESGGNIVHAGACAAVSAALIISQYSVPDIIDSSTRLRANEMVKALPVKKL